MDINKIRRNSMYLLLFGLILLLAACTNEPAPENEIYIAKVSDFEDNIFTNTQSQSIGLLGGDLRIAGIYDQGAKSKSSLDSILSSISGGTGDQVEKIFTNVEIKTKEDNYYITADEGISLTFTKIGERIIKDENGIEYTSPKYSN